MTTNTWRVCLFGGALLGAGLANAQAQTISHCHDYGNSGSFVSYGRISAYSASPVTIYQFADDPLGFSNAGYTAGDFSALVTGDTSGCSFTHERGSVDEFNSSAVVCVLWFWALEDGAVRVRWGGQRSSDTDAVLYDSTADADVLAYYGWHSGDHVVMLEKGHRYRFRFRSSAQFVPTADAWGEFRVIESCNDADLDGNGILNFDDLDAFVDAYLGGCP